MLLNWSALFQAEKLGYFINKLSIIYIRFKIPPQHHQTDYEEVISTNLSVIATGYAYLKIIRCERAFSILVYPGLARHLGYVSFQNEL